jgi:beta-galactosidase
VHILPHWNWPDRVGQAVPVFVYTNGDSAELFLNGRSLGRRTKAATAPDRDQRGAYYAVTDRYRLKWPEVPYEPGELKAVAYQGEEMIGEAVVRTAGEPAALRLSPDRLQLVAGDDDLCYVTVEAADAAGNFCPLAENLVRFRVEGPAEIAAVGNGNPLSLESFQASERKLFHGKALVILRAKEGTAGAIRLTAESDGLERAAATVVSR